MMVTSLVKGTLVDVPLALTEGLHNLPELYGEQVRKHDKITDWKSGTAEAGKVCASCDDRKEGPKPKC